MNGQYCLSERNVKSFPLCALDSSNERGTILALLLTLCVILNSEFGITTFGSPGSLDYRNVVHQSSILWDKITSNNSPSVRCKVNGV